MDANARLPEDLPAASQALALANSYDLFARLFLEGLTAELLPWVAAVPELKARLPGSAEFSAGDTLAANHYRLFGMDVFPYQSVFLDPQALLGGDQAEKASRFFARCGFDPAGGEVSTGKGTMPDHIGIELQCLSFLCAAEADAWDDNLEPVASHLRLLQRRLLDELLLPWLPALVQAVRQQGDPFYSSLSDLALELVLAHRHAVRSPITPSGPPEDILPALTHSAALLENPKTSLEDIAGYLVAPALSGLYLSRSDLDRLSRRLGLPHGFGDRRQTLANLLRTASDYDRLPELIDALLHLLQDWEAAFQTHREGSSPLSGIAFNWLERLRATRSILMQLSASINEIVAETTFPNS